MVFVYVICFIMSCGIFSAPRLKIVRNHPQHLPVTPNMLAYCGHYYLWCRLSMRLMLLYCGLCAIYVEVNLPEMHALAIEMCLHWFLIGHISFYCIYLGAINVVLVLLSIWLGQFRIFVQLVC